MNINYFQINYNYKINLIYYLNNNKKNKINNLSI